MDAATRTGFFPSSRRWFALGCFLAGTGVLAGALGAHQLKRALDDEMLGAWNTAVHYQIIHALGLLAVAYARERFGAKPGDRAGWCFALGALLFSGSLYALALSGIRPLGFVTPFGGVLFLAGWGLLGWGVLRGSGHGK